MTTNQKQLKTYDQLKAFIQAGRDKTQRKIANNTIARLENNTITIRLYDTDIVMLFRDGSVILARIPEIHQTYTTKERINRFIPRPYVVNQIRKVWYIRNYENQELYTYLGPAAFDYDQTTKKWELVV